MAPVIPDVSKNEPEAPAHHAKAPSKYLRISRSGVTKGLGILLIALLVILVGYHGVKGYWPWATALEKQTAETNKTVNAVGAHLLLPKNETPTIAVVANAEALHAQQPFFADAINGDQVLIYPQARLAIIWSPSRNKIIKVGPIDVNNNGTPTTTPTPAASDTTQAAAKPRVAFENGSTKSGLAANAEATLTSAGVPFTEASKGNAVSSSYTSTIVVAVNPAFASQAAQIASALGGQVGSLPAGEKSSDADIIVIIGVSTP